MQLALQRELDPFMVILTFAVQMWFGQFERARPELGGIEILGPIHVAPDPFVRHIEPANVLGR